MNETQLIFLIVMLNNIAIFTMFGLSSVLAKRLEKTDTELRDFRRKVGV
jgi:hypothetical protein